MTPRSSADDPAATPGADTPEDMVERGSMTLRLSLNILESLSQAGWTLVPALPDPEMIDAGIDAGATNPEQAAAIYGAMIKATS